MYNEKDEDLLLLSSTFIKQKEYWVKKLSGDIPETGMPFAKHDSQSEAVERKEIEVIIPEGLCSQLIRLGKQSDLSIYIILLAGLKSLIHRYTGSEDMLVISPVYRPHRSKGTLNHYVYIRTFLKGETTFKGLVLTVRRSLLEAYENQDYPFDRLEEHLLLGGSPLLCSMDTLHDGEDIGRIKSRLVFSFAREGDTIRGCILYDPGTFDTFYIERMAAHFVNILEDAVPDVNKRISQLSVLSGQEEEKLLVEFNGGETGSEYPVQETVRQLFAQQVEKTPHCIAVEETAPRAKGIFPYAITYRQLNKEADRLARLLKEKGIKPNRIVGLMSGPSLESVIAALGILKVGGAFLPIDPGLPQSRILAMLKDCSATLLLTTTDIAGRFSFAAFGGESS